MRDICKGYVGVSCVDGSCPQVIRDEYGFDSPYSCNECWLYKGCNDCALSGTAYCCFGGDND